MAWSWRKGVERYDSSSLWMAGIVFLGLAASMIPCIIVCLVFHEDLVPFAVPFLLYAVLGGICLGKFRMGYVRPCNVLVMLAVIWFVSIGFGMIPFWMGGMEWIDALMESASGFTTAGCSTISDFSEWSNGILFYRGLSNWVGGIMIILIVMIVLPMAGVGSRSLVSNEMSGSESSNVSIRVRDAAIQFSFIYLLLTGIMFILLVMFGTDPFDSLTLSLCTVSTGGLISGDMHISTAAQIIMMIFMFLGGTNFYLHFKAVFLRRPNVYIRNSEFLALVGVCIATSLVLFFTVKSNLEVDPGMLYLDSLFAAISAATTTGFTVGSMGSWPKITMIIMFAVALMGASAGSTSGGIKLSRIIILIKYIKSSINHLLHPNNIYEVYMDGSPVSTDYVRTSAIIFMLFIMTIAFFTVLFMLCGVDSISSVETVLAMVTSFGTVDVHIELMSPFLKLMMVIMMWAGRLEILIALAIISPKVWKEHFKDVQARYRRTSAR